MNDTFTKSLTTLLPQVITLRRDLHAHPETAFNEHRTAAKVAEWLKRLPNIKIRTGVAGTGIVADIGADRPGPCLALRADMDALPMDDLCGKPHASTIPGFCHACGHDGHTACLAGAATLLTAFPERAVGPIRLIF
ncbi:MAG: amidohydrolase, partial [Lentisphaerae bacterium]|nr:amidohydrolase [Lentisphaerota bacterium]